MMTLPKTTLYLLAPSEALPEQYAAGLCKIGITGKETPEERFTWASTLGYNKFSLRFKTEQLSRRIERNLKRQFDEDKIKHYPSVQEAHKQRLNTFGGNEEWFVESPFLLVKSNLEFKTNISFHLNLSTHKIENMLQT